MASMLISAAAALDEEAKRDMIESFLKKKAKGH